jgi:hypothetical protein
MSILARAPISVMAACLPGRWACCHCEEPADGVAGRQRLPGRLPLANANTEYG